MNSSDSKPPRLPADGFVTTAELAQHLGVTQSHIKGLRRRGLGPSFIKISPHCVRYPVAAVQEWLQAHAHKEMEK
jgi:predicted DNA-binding transcriptional regulator AlpA